MKHLVFKDEIHAVQKEVEALTAKGVDKIIVLGHGGYGFDKKLALEVEGVDVVVGGHSHTFLYSGKGS